MAFHSKPLRLEALSLSREEQQLHMLIDGDMGMQHINQSDVLTRKRPTSPRDARDFHGDDPVRIARTANY